MSPEKRCKAVVAIPLVQSLLEELSEFDITFLPTGRSDDSAFLAAVSESEGVLVSSGVTVDGEVIASAPHLRVISTMSVGFDHIDVRAAREREITVTITPVLSDAVADLTMMLMTMLARRIPEAMRAVASGGWAGLALGGDIAHKRLLIVGFGRIGRAVATRALAAGMEVTYYDAHNELPDFPGVTREPDLLDGLGKADFVSLHVDLNPRTRGFIGAAELEAMKPTAFLVNTARGGVVDQPGLTKALVQGRIAGAALDVLEEEPPGPDEPLLALPNVIVLPHIGSATTETRAAMARCAVENLAAVLRYESTPFALD
jgi:phosphoglycerate dehydrogenase-like enzyme